jgi:tetratricopeptide (TPR) repeat protein
MKPLCSCFFSSLRTLALVCAALASPAYADEYSDVSQLMRSGKSAEAMSKADQFLSTKPRDPQMRFLKGVIQRDTGKTADAITTFTRLTEEYPELPEPYNNLAVLHAGQSQYDKARTALEMAIRTNPSYATAHENLGDVYAKLASQAYSKALQLDGENQAVPPKLALIRELFVPQSKTSKTPSTTPAIAPPISAVPVAVPVPAAPAAPVAMTPIATPATTPAPAPTAPPKAAENPASTKEVESAVKTWAQAWSSRDVKTYLRAYGKEFDPPGGQSRSAWEQERHTKISSKSSIAVKLENLSVSVQADKAVARFRQDYRSGALAVSSRKILELKKKGDSWQIIKETVGG